MADKTDSKTAAAETPAAAPSGGGIKALLPLIITIVAMPALAFAMTNFVLLPKLQKGLGITPGAAASGAAKAEGPEKKESVALSKLLVNIAGTMGAHYLLVSVSIVGTAADFKEKTKEYDAQLRDMATGVLATKTLADLEKPGARNLIRTELLSGFNNILGSSAVQELYFTEFGIQ